MSVSDSETNNCNALYDAFTDLLHKEFLPLKTVKAQSSTQRKECIQKFIQILPSWFSTLGQICGPSERLDQKIIFALHEWCNQDTANFFRTNFNQWGFEIEENYMIALGTLLVSHCKVELPDSLRKKLYAIFQLNIAPFVVTDFFKRELEKLNCIPLLQFSPSSSDGSGHQVEALPDESAPNEVPDKRYQMLKSEFLSAIQDPTLVRLTKEMSLCFNQMSQDGCLAPFVSFLQYFQKQTTPNSLPNA
jgi:hypothetical protein